MLKEKVIFPDWINYSYDLPMMKVWDNMIIESALKTYYNKSLPLMIEALQANLTVQSYFLYEAPVPVCL